MMFDLGRQWFVCAESSDSAVLILKRSSLIGVVEVRARRVGVVTSIKSEHRAF